jgi:hypothetical protein
MIRKRRAVIDRTIARNTAPISLKSIGYVSRHEFFLNLVIASDLPVLSTIDQLAITSGDAHKTRCDHIRHRLAHIMHTI